MKTSAKYFGPAVRP